MWPMLKTHAELLNALARAVRDRRIAQGWTQIEAAERSGMPYRTWRRLETGGEGSIPSLIQAAIALRCEDNLASLFPPPAASSMDELLHQQVAAAPPRPRQRATRRKTPT